MNQAKHAPHQTSKTAGNSNHHAADHHHPAAKPGASAEAPAELSDKRATSFTDARADEEFQTQVGAERASAKPPLEDFNVIDRRFWAEETAKEPQEAASPEGETTAAPNGSAAHKTRKPSYVEELEKKLQEKEDRLQAVIRQHKEALSEFNQAKARMSRDIVKEINAGKRYFLTELLDVVDNLERALTSINNGQDLQSITTGVKLLAEQFLAKLQEFGVRKQDSLGVAFDPALHEAVSTIPVPEPEQDGKVVGVVKECYLLEGETLRHALVAVGKYHQA